MNFLYLIPGVILMAIAVHDLLSTTFSPHGAGALSGRITSFIWGIFFYISRLTGKRRYLNSAGIIIVCAVIFSWVVLIWAGNTLIFASDPNSVVNSNTNEAASFKDLIYYTGYILSTMGNGDFKANTDSWRLYSAIISFSGLILITIAITYMVPVLSAITSRRTLSIQIASLGDSANDMLLNHWNGENFKKLEQPLTQLTQSIARQGQLQLAYPVLHYFHNDNKLTALLPNLAALDEALSTLLLYVPERLYPDSEYLYPARKAVTSFLTSLQGTFIRASEEKAPPYELEELAEAGVPLHKPTAEEEDCLEQRRRILKSMLQNDGWTWDELKKSAFNEKLDLRPQVNVE